MHRRPTAARRLPERGRHRGFTSPWPRRSKIVVAVIGAVTTAAVAVGVSSWVVSVTAGSSGEGQAATISNLTISATASPGAGNLLSPGSTGDVVLTIANSNDYPVTITAVNLPTNTTYATGYTNSALVATQAGCLAATPSLVSWNYATGSTGSSHTLTTPLIVAAGGQANTRSSSR